MLLGNQMPLPALFLKLDGAHTSAEEISKKGFNSFVVKAVYLQPISISSDWYSEDAHTARMRGSMFNPRCVCYIIFGFCARLARKCERSDPCVDFYSTPSRTYYDCKLFEFLIPKVARWYSSTSTDR